MPHPVVPILLWAAFAVAMQALPVAALLLLGIPLTCVAFAVGRARLVSLLRRTRWIMLSLLLVYAYATPGAAVIAALAQYSPTHEGLVEGLVQLSRLVFALAGLALLLGLLSQRQLVAGLYALAYPLCWLGLSRERIAVRLALTLHYAESAMLDADWRGSIGRMLEPAEAVGGSIELHTAPFDFRDGMLLVAAFALLALVWA